MLIAKEGGNFESCPVGPVQAVISNVYDLGMQKQSGMYGETIAHQIVIMWEVNHQIKSGKFAGQRFVLSKTYTNSMGQKSNLYKDLKSMIGDKAKPGIDLEKLIGLNVQLNVQENAKGYSTIISIMPLQQGTQQMKPELPKTHKPEWIVKKQSLQIVENNDGDFYNESPVAQQVSDTFSDGEPVPESDPFKNW
jgi:hypothetical protein